MKKYKILVAIILITGIIIIGKSNEFNNLLTYSNNIINIPIETIKQNEKITICIDPGHQLKGDSTTEQIAPNSNSYKIKVSSGTAGVATKKPEYELNLEASLKLKKILENRGYEVVMTRESHDVNISNKERAIFANEKNADMIVRIHADSSNNQSITGASILIPSSQNDTANIYNDSFKCANLVKAKMESQGFKVNGVIQRNDLTGFNWSEVPVILVEMGFMSNYAEDQNMSNPKYQNKMMTSIGDGLDKYFGRQ